MVVKFHRWADEDFTRCSQCKSVLHFDEDRMAWICKPVCAQPTIIVASIQAVSYMDRNSDGR